MGDLKKVEIRLAFEWTCEECGKDNFEHTITQTLTRDQQRAMFEEHNIINEWEDVPENMGFEFNACPKIVKCDYCGEEFETTEDSVE